MQLFEMHYEENLTTQTHDMAGMTSRIKSGLAISYMRRIWQIESTYAACVRRMQKAKIINAKK